MDPIVLARELIDIDSTTGNEAAAGDFLLRTLLSLGYAAEFIEAAAGRSNVVATPLDTPHPPLFFSTHMDCVPPFFPSREEGDLLFGRGACDAKGIIAAQIAAAERLRESGIAAGLLFTVGEERDSIGAKAANAHARESRFMINGEPTDNRLAIATKGALHVEVTAHGKMAHSAYPELGESAVEKLLDALSRIRQVRLPQDPEIGPATLNIGTIEGGRAPNVIPDRASARILIRTVGASEPLKASILAAAGDAVSVEFPQDTPFIRLRTVAGIPTMVAAFATDIPYLTNWGEPLLFGPGSIHVAHTEREHVSKRELLQAVDRYVDIARALLA